MGEHELDVYLLNTGSVGGPAGAQVSRKVRISHSSAIVKGIAEGKIEGRRDPDFGYQIATRVPGIGRRRGRPAPRELYEDQGRADEYERVVERLKREREEFLRGFPGSSRRDRGPGARVADRTTCGEPAPEEWRRRSISRRPDPDRAIGPSLRKARRD